MVIGDTLFKEALGIDVKRLEQRWVEKVPLSAWLS
jgi:hypothetical protein